MVLTGFFNILASANRVMWHELATSGTLHENLRLQLFYRETKKASPKGRLLIYKKTAVRYGVRTRKNWAGRDLFTGMELVNVPVLLKALCTLVVQSAFGNVRLVVVRTV